MIIGSVDKTAETQAKMLLTLLTKCDIVKNALLWQDMPTSLILANIKQA